MRIVHLTTQWSATTGGPTTYVASLQRELTKRGHDVRVVTTDGGEGADVATGSFPLRDVRMVRLLYRSAPDIIHVHNSVRLLFAALVCRVLRPRVRVVFTFHTQPITRVFISGLSAPQRDYGVISALVARVLLRNADMITSVSDSIIARHNAAYPLGIRRYLRIPSGGDPRDHSSGRTRSNHQRLDERAYPLLVSVGVMTWDWKVAGHLVSVRAVDRLRRLYPGVLLLIAGDGQHRGLVEQEVVALGLESHVRLLGNLSPSPLLDDADIYVHMGMNEGCSLAIIEAMHAGKAIVAANAGGTPEVLVDGETALLIEPDPDELAAAVQRLIDDERYRGRLGERAREAALARHTWFAIAEQYAATYQSLLGS
jgi:glycosyltransferase involved in cell wall biosynthesis